MIRSRMGRHVQRCCFDVSVSCWNIANLGGGYGYPQERDKGVIKSIAEILINGDADVNVIIEVLDRNRPNWQTKFSKLPLENYSIYHNAKIRIDLSKIILPLLLDFLGGQRPQEANLKLNASYRNSLIKAFNAMIEDIVEEGAIENRQDLEKLVNGKTSKLIDEFVESAKGDIAAAIREAAKDKRDELVKKQGRFEDDAVAIKEEINDLELRLSEKQGGQATKIRNKIEKKNSYIRERESRLQEEREKLDSDIEESYDEAVKLTRRHSQNILDACKEYCLKSIESFSPSSGHDRGIGELRRIEEVMNSKKTVYKLYYPTSNGKASYTRGETYAFICKGHVSMGEMSFLDGFRYRAPLLAWVTVQNSKIGVMAYHAPSDSPRNREARTKDLDTLIRVCEKLRKDNYKNLIVLAMDSNVNTREGIVFKPEKPRRITNCELKLSPFEWLAQVAGDKNWVKQSYFLNAPTSLRRTRTVFVHGPELLYGLLGMYYGSKPKERIDIEKLRNADEEILGSLVKPAALVESFIIGPASEHRFNAFDKVIPICGHGLVKKLKSEFVHPLVDYCGKNLQKARKISDHQMVLLRLQIRPSGPNKAP